MSLNRNIIANYLGQGWSGLIGLVLVPFYVRYLGMEAYGLIGFFSLLQTWLVLLDIGMTPSLNREVARYTAGASSAESIRNLLRSAEIASWCFAVLISVAIWAISGWFAKEWLRVGRLSVEVVAQAIAIMGIVASLRLVEGIYRGAILGLQKQVLFNAINSLLATLRAVGAIGVLAWISPTITAYFLWHFLVSVLSVAILAFSVHKCLPDADVPSRFSWSALKGVGRFAGGVFLSSALALLLTQVDKILLSRMLSLDVFGSYSLAAAVATALTLFVTPVTQAFFPRFTELVAKNDWSGLAAAFHRSAQLVTVLTAPYALLLMLFAHDILISWTGNVDLARDAAPMLAVLAFGMLLNGLLYIPFMLQLSFGWAGFSVKANLLAVIVLVPAILWAIPNYGAIGAAWAWVLLNTGYVTISAHVMHRKLLKGEKLKWYGLDVLLPVLAATTVGVCGRFISLAESFNAVGPIWIFVFWGMMVLAAVMASSELRGGIIQRFVRRERGNA